MPVSEIELAIEQAVRAELTEAIQQENVLFAKFINACSDSNAEPFEAQHRRTLLNDAAATVRQLRNTLGGILDARRIYQERMNRIK